MGTCIRTRRTFVLTGETFGATSAIFIVIARTIAGTIVSSYRSQYAVPEGSPSGMLPFDFWGESGCE